MLQVTIKNLSDKEDIYKEIELLEQQFEQGNIDVKLVRSYHIYCSKIYEVKRCFDTLIKYKIYEKADTQDAFFRVCCRSQQRAIYDRYMPDYLPQYIQQLTKKTIPYANWYAIIFLWLRSLTIIHKETLALHFVATISLLEKQNNKKPLLDDMRTHQIYKKMIKIYSAFIKKPDMDSLKQLNEIGYKHAINVRKMDNFIDDPWVAFYDDLKYSDEYIKFTKPYYELLNKHNISYQDKLIIFLNHDTNIGDNYSYINIIINWSLKNKIPLIAFLTKRQAQWIAPYYKDYIDKIIIRDSNIRIPAILKFGFPAANKAISLGETIFDIPPYYYPASNKIHFNHYTHDKLHDKTADIGKPVPISNIPDKIKNQNQKLFQQIQIDPQKIILLEPKSFFMDGVTGSNILLLDFWKALVVRLKKEGFYPIINIASADEKNNIDNAPSLYLPLTHIVDFINNIGGFISIRTGLCNLLISSDNPKKYCVYPSENIDWGNDLVPWYYIVNFKSETTEQHIDDIINSLTGKTVKIFENQPFIGYAQFPDYCPD